MRSFTKVAATAAAAALVSTLPIGVATAATPLNLETGSTISTEIPGIDLAALKSISAELFAGLDTGSLGSTGGTDTPDTETPGGTDTETPDTETPDTETPAGPTVTLSKANGIAAAGESITLTGSGFSGAGAGLYVGLVQDSKFSATDAGAWMTTKWLKTTDIVDGAWTATIDVTAVAGDSDCLVNTCSIYTVAAHGSADRTQDTKTPVTFQG